MQKKVTIIILTWNGFSYTKSCLQSLENTVNFDQTEIIVVDNGSSDGTIEYLTNIPWIKTIFNRENLGYVKGNNIAIETVSPERDIILLNNDIEIHDSEWINKFQKTAYGEEKIGIVGCRIRRPNGMLQHAGTYMPDFTYWGQQIGGGEKDVNQFDTDRDVEGVVFACVYIKSDVIKKIGGLCADYFSYFEDTDYCLSALQAGFRVVNCGALTVVHHEHASTKANNLDMTSMFLDSQKIFKKKWMDFLGKRLDMNVCWHSTFSHPYGYAMISQGLAIELENFGVEVAYKYLYGPATVFPVKDDDSSDKYQINIIKKRKYKKNASKIIFGQGDAFNYVKKGYRIGYTMLETSGIPKDWVRQANSMDEVWTPSPFNAWTFRKSGVKRPICIMPLGVDTNYFHPRIDGYKLKNEFTFLSIFEWGERKAPEVLIRAFNQTFTKEEPVVLICKYINYDGDVDVNEQIRKMDLDPNGGNIIYSVNQHVPYYQLPQLYKSSDCFVLPTRGEGWGMPILEAMACGLPVIATYWSAQQTFMTDWNSYPLQVARLIDAKAKCPYYKGFKWADPDFNHLKMTLRHVYENPEEAKQKGINAALDVNKNWSVARCGSQMRKRLEEIDTELSVKQKPSFHLTFPGNSKKVIGFDISRGIGEQITGIGRVSLNMVEALSRLSAEDNPYNFILFPGFSEFVHPLYMKQFFFDQIDDPRFTVYKGPLPAYSCQNNFVPGVDLVHSTAYSKPDTMGQKLIITVHDLTFLTHAQFHTQENIQFCKKNMKKAVESECHFIAVSENTKSDIMRYYDVPEKRITVVYNSVNPEHFKKIPADHVNMVLNKYDLQNGFFLYVGSIEPRKNLESVVEAIQMFAGKEKLAVIGADGWKNSKLSSLLRGNKKIRMLGYVSQDELPAFYNAAIASIYPSIYEGFGMPVLESISCGTPVIASNNSSIPEVAGDASILLNDPTDAESIFDAMNIFSGDEAKRALLSKMSIEQSLRFSPDKMARSLIRLYTSLLT